MIDVVDLHKRHGKSPVLRGVTLSVSEGQVAAIVGPSGGGKSTFLRCLNGLETFDAGQVRVGAERLTPGVPDRAVRAALARIRRQVGMVFQQFHLFPHRTVLENVIEAPILVARRDREEATAHARELLDRVGMLEHQERLPGNLSGGQQQRVAIARALAMRPRAILFDEPTSALDPRMTNEVLEVLGDLAADGQTMIVVTHAEGFARRAANVVFVFHEGRVLESGPPGQVFDAPRDPRTADFLRGEAVPGAS